jgi:hypothetical protein
MEMRLPKLVWLESGEANTQRVARLGVPFTGGSQFKRDWRATLRSMGAWRAGTFHSLVAPKSSGTGGGRGVQWVRGRLGAAMEMRRPKLVWLESGAVNIQDTARLGFPYTADGQSCVVRGRLAGKQNPTLPLFSEIPNLIPPSDIFEVKIWRTHGFGRAIMFHEVRSTCALTEKGSRTSFPSICVWRPPCL